VPCRDRDTRGRRRRRGVHTGGTPIDGIARRAARTRGTVAGHRCAVARRPRLSRRGRRLLVELTLHTFFLIPGPLPAPTPPLPVPGTAAAPSGRRLRRDRQPDPRRVGGGEQSGGAGGAHHRGAPHRPGDDGAGRGHLPTAGRRHVSLYEGVCGCSESPCGHTFAAHRGFTPVLRRAMRLSDRRPFRRDGAHRQG
jgi:hypothetical protein